MVFIKFKNYNEMDELPLHKNTTILWITIMSIYIDLLYL